MSQQPPKAEPLQPTSSGLFDRSVEKGKLKHGKQDQAGHSAKPSPAAPEEEHADTGQLEVELTQEKLVRLQQIFEEADDDDYPGLDMDEFRVAMRRAIGPHLTDAEIDTMFMKVDSNCDGTVDWDEYLSYMLLECRGKDRMADVMTEKPFPKYPRRINTVRYVRIHDSINKIDFAPSVTKNTENLNFYKVTDEETGRYVTITREGVVNMFNQKLKHVRQYKVEQDSKQRFRGTLVTGTAILPNLNLLAVATTSCTITCYDLNSNKGAKEFERRMVITDLEICATCLSYWTDKYNEGHNILMWGDVRGNISALVITEAVIFNPILYGNKMKVPFADIMKGRIAGAKGYKLFGIHNDFVKQVRYVAQLNGFLSACRDPKTGLYLGDLEQRHHGDHFKVQGGVFSFDYSKSNSVVVTGGKDGVVRVWNPYVKKKPVMIMHGHNCPIIEIRINEKLEHVISLSELKEIRIYDLNTQSCVQIIKSKWINLGSKSISAVYYNASKQALILANNSMVLFQHQVGHNKDANLHSHTQPVTSVLYNSLFGQIVSGSADSQVCVWNIKTGERIIQFTAHINEKAESMDKEITCMSFDPTKRRLITATRDGSINIWNFNNGACLRSIQSYCEEVTSILWSGQRIFTAGWSQRVIVYIDSKEEKANEVLTTWAEEHKDDIQAIANYEPSILASGSYDGDIIIWSLETGHVTMQFNAFKGTKPFSRRMGIEVQLGKAVSADSMETLKSESTASSSTSAQSVTSMEDKPNIVKSRETAPRRISLFPGLNRQMKSPRGYRRFLPQKNQEKPTEQNSADNDEDLSSDDDDRARRAYESRFAQRKRRSAITDTTGHGVIQNQKDSVEVLVFLTKRQNEKGVATLLSAGGRGWVRAWSIHHDGGLVGQFNATHEKGNTILTMVTDPDEKFLITGDSQGYVKIWHIEGYCDGREAHTAGSSRRSMSRNRAGSGGTAPLGLEQIDPKLKKKFPFLGIHSDLRLRAGSQDKHDPPLESTNPTKTHKTPTLLNSVRVHLQAITCMSYVPEEEYILTGSVDNSVRCINIAGRFIGICGQRPKWNEDTAAETGHGNKNQPNEVDVDIPQFGKKTKPVSNIMSRSISGLALPADVRRVASATTLKVYYGGVKPLGTVARNLVMFLQQNQLKKTRISPRKGDYESAESVGDELIAMVRDKNEPKVKEPSSSKDFRLPKIFPEVKEGKGIFREKSKKGQITVRLPKLTMHQNQLRVYSSMPCQDLEQIKPIDPPSTIVEITARKVLVASGGRGRGRLRKRPSKAWSNFQSYRRKSLQGETRLMGARLSPLEQKPQNRSIRSMMITE